MNGLKELEQELNPVQLHYPEHEKTRSDAGLCSQQFTPGQTRKKEPMRVALLASEMTTYGGIQSFMHRIAEAVTTLTLPPAIESYCISLNDHLEQLRLIPAISQSATVWGAGKSKVSLIAHLLFAQPRLDVLIVGHVSLAPLALAMKLSGRLQSYFVQLHGIEAWRKVSVLERLSLLGAKRILATMQFTAGECARYNRIPLDRFHIIPLCANEREHLLSPQFRLNGAFKLLCVARQDQSERYKGIEMLFDALAMLKTSQLDIHLNLVGSGNDQTRLRAVADELGVALQVTFWGSLSDADLVAAYKDCDLFVMPSQKEGFGIVFLEAMQFGKPCIGGNHGGTPDVIEHGKSGFLVEYGDTQSLAEHIRILVDNASLRRAMGERGRELVTVKFSKRAFDSAYAALMKS